MPTMTISPLSPLQSDYVTKKEFGVFQGEVKNRFDQVDNCFDAVDNKFKAIDNRFDNIDNKLDRLKIEVVEQNKSDMATWREKIQDDFKKATEIINGNIDTLEQRINKKLDTKLSQSYFEEYMERLQNNLFKTKR